MSCVYDVSSTDGDNWHPQRQPRQRREFISLSQQAERDGLFNHETKDLQVFGHTVQSQTPHADLEQPDQVDEAVSAQESPEPIATPGEERCHSVVRASHSPLPTSANDYTFPLTVPANALHSTLVDLSKAYFEMPLPVGLTFAKAPRESLANHWKGFLATSIETSSWQFQLCRGRKSAPHDPPALTGSELPLHHRNAS